MGYEYRVAAPGLNRQELGDDIARSLQQEEFATVTKAPGRLSVSVQTLGKSSWGEHASISLSEPDIIVTIHGAPAPVTEALLGRVRSALMKRGVSDEFEEL